jgi:hypothetical protein
VNTVSNNTADETHPRHLRSTFNKSLQMHILKAECDWSVGVLKIDISLNGSCRSEPRWAMASSLKLSLERPYKGNLFSTI